MPLIKLATITGCMTLAACGALFLSSGREGDVLEAMMTRGPELIGAGEVRIFAAGDMLFDRHIRERAVERGGDFLFACMDPLLGEADFAVANLEGPITPNASQSVGSVPGAPDNYIFTFPTSTAGLLARHNFRAVSIGNNHIYNFGLAGLLSTQAALSEARVGAFGGVKGYEGVFETEERGIPLAFVAYNEFGGSPYGEVAKTIAAERAKGRVVLVYAHWGDEYLDATARLRPIATAFATSGASAILGAHPHIVLGHERIGKTLVYYSLGNFIFDQYWNASVSSGLALILRVKKDGTVEADEHPTRILESGQTCPLVQVKVI